jgi:AcrR family transcriptional regulator
MSGVTKPTVPISNASLAERKRQLVRDELVEAALKLLTSQGFETTTIDQIVATAGVSRRTFFRYFRSKEDVIVAFLGDVGAQLCATLAARPVGEPPAVALRHAVSIFVQTCLEHPEKSLRLTKLMLGTPALLARFLERQARWRGDLAAELARRAGLDPRTDLRPALAAAVALAAFDTALNRWADSFGSHDLADLTDQTFAVVASALNTSSRPTGTTGQTVVDR